MSRGMSKPLSIVMVLVIAAMVILGVGALVDRYVWELGEVAANSSGVLD